MKAAKPNSLIIFVMLLLLSSCYYVPAGFAPSTTPVESNEFTILGHATGEMSYFSLFGFIPFGKLNYDEAIADAVGKFEGGRALINVRSRFEVTYVIVGFINRLVVEGDVVK